MTIRLRNNATGRPFLEGGEEKVALAFGKGMIAFGTGRANSSSRNLAPPVALPAIRWCLQRQSDKSATRAEETDHAKWSHPRAAELHHHTLSVHAHRVRNPDRGCGNGLYDSVLEGEFLRRASIAQILQQTDIPKLATIILIVLAASLLGLLRIIAGEAVIALLSGIAGYVLGNRAAPKESPPG